MATRTTRPQTPEIKVPTGLRNFGKGIGRFFTPWRLPPGTTPSDEMSEEEMVWEAQESRPLLRELGLHDSGLLHPNEVNLRYLRTCQYLGKVPAKPYVWQFAITFFIALFMGVMFYFGPTQEGAAFAGDDSSSDSETALAWEKPLYVVVGLLTGGLFGSGAGYSVRTMIQFWTVHAPGRIAQKRTENGISRTVAVYELPLPRLAFRRPPSRADILRH